MTTTVDNDPEVIAMLADNLTANMQALDEDMVKKNKEWSERAVALFKSSIQIFFSKCPTVDGIQFRWYEYNEYNDSGYDSGTRASDFYILLPRTLVQEGDGDPWFGEWEDWNDGEFDFVNDQAKEEATALFNTFHELVAGFLGAHAERLMWRTPGLKANSEITIHRDGTIEQTDYYHQDY